MNSQADKTLIEKNLIEYVTQKDKYFYNYLIDGDIAQFIKSFDEYLKKAQNPKNVSYTEWQNIEMDKITKKQLTQNEIDFLKFKLIFTTLMMYDKNYDENYEGSHLDYRFLQSNSLNIIVVLGPKKWKENKVTFGSCPFQNIRVISLNERDYKATFAAYNLLYNETLFNGKELKATCVHFTKDADLSIEATQELNFKNLGIKVAAKQSITKDKIYAIMQKAKESSILIFPELLVDWESEGFIENYAETSMNLKLIIKGSHHISESKHYTNTAYCSVRARNSYRRNAFSYNKRIPFTMGYTPNVAKAYNIDTAKHPLDKSELLVEDIIVDDRITILPYDDCIVGIAICRDVLDLLDKNNPLHKYCDFVDLMLVISENNGDTNMFVGIAECLARWHNCATLYTNALHEAGSDSNKYLEMSFALYPNKTTKHDNEYENRSSTSVSGVITYASQGVYKIDEENNPLVSILNSTGIKYEELTDDQKKSGCKEYTFIAE